MLTDRLEAEGYAVESASDGESGLARALEGRADVIVLDGMLPGRDGLDVCRILRQLGVTTPVLMLSARGQVIDRVVGLRFGADDYLVKPFEVVELLARIDALAARGHVSAAPGGVWRRRRQPGPRRRGGVAVDLTALEFKLLVYFIDHRQVMVSRDELPTRWGYHAMPTTRTVDACWGAAAAEPDPSAPRYLLTMHGHGYKFVG
jgi:two-component system alkaline phosphatase synthesis response regulator PhoP